MNDNKNTPKLTLKRDENGILFSYDEQGNKVGRIYEHGDDDIEKSIVEIEEV